MKFNNVLVEKKGSVALVCIDRPNKLNALNRETIEELHEAFAGLHADRAIRAIVLRGSGPKAFVAGADIAEFAGYSSEEGRQLAARGQETLFDFIEHLGTPVIAAINGFALGGGLELAMACHFRVASHNARMGLPEVSLGVIPGYGGTQRLPMLVGKGRALEMILTGGMVDRIIDQLERDAEFLAVRRERGLFGFAAVVIDALDVDGARARSSRCVIGAGRTDLHRNGGR